MAGGQPDVGLLDQILVPVASIDDALSTCSAIRTQLATEVGSVTVVHVIKHTEGGIDPVPVDARKEDAEAIFDAVRDEYGGLVDETETVYGTDIAAEIVSEATARGATAIVFMPHREGRLVRWLSGDVALSLLTDSEVPVLALHRGE